MNRFRAARFPHRRQPRRSRARDAGRWFSGAFVRVRRLSFLEVIPMRFRPDGRKLLLMLLLTALASCSATLLLVEWARPGPGGSGSGTEVPGQAESGGWSEEERKKLDAVLNLIDRRHLYGADRGQLLDGAIRGMLESLGDPYTEYMPPGEAERYSDSLEGAFTGIGAVLMVEKGDVVVVTPLAGSPAERAGLKAGDILLSVNGQPLKGLSLAEAVEKIRGPKGTKAKLRVLRPGVESELELVLVRDRISQETVRSELTEDGVGRIWINQFTSDTFERVKAELAGLEAKGMRALVIDLRNNPGGILTSALATAELFVPGGRVLIIYEDADGARQEERSQGQLSSPKTYPVVVLVNRGSASAAEVLAGALKHSAGALVIGEETHGKGTIQMTFQGELGDGSLVKLTVYKWLMPDGTWLNGRGLEPDVQVSLPAWFSAPRLPRDRVLKYDDAGEDVRILQLILEGLNLPADRSDGYFSRGTEESVKEFQRREGLPVTGEVDEATAERLEEALYLNILHPENDTQWMAAHRLALEAAGGNSDNSDAGIAGQDPFATGKEEHLS